MNRLVKNSAQLLTANVVAQAIGLVVYPILTRLYAPEDFGLLNLFLSIGGILVILSTCEYHNAIVLPANEDKAKAVFHAGGVILVGLTILIALTIPFSSPIATLFKAPQLSHWYWLLPIYVLACGAWNLLNYYFIRHQQFRYAAEYQIVQSTLNAGTKAGAGYAGFLSGGLIVGSVLAPICSLIVSWGRLGKKKLELLQHPLDNIKQVLHEYRNFPLFSMPKSLVNALSSNLPALLITPFFGLAETGFFSMAITLGLRPLNMISNSIYQTFFQDFSTHVNQKKHIKSNYSQFVIRAFMLVIPSFALLYWGMPYLVALFLGDGWESTALYLQIMLPWFAMVVVGASVSFIPDIFQQQRKAFIIEFIYLLLRIAAIVIGIWKQNLLFIIVGYSSVGVCVILYQLIWYHRILDQYEKTLIAA